MSQFTEVRLQYARSLSPEVRLALVLEQERAGVPQFTCSTNTASKTNNRERAGVATLSLLALLAVLVGQKYKY